ncbi:DUF6795 domain-containing protein [Shewanella vesiculosa]|uniref:DUF6795 domain-containing protein n=1 Tax=Shewanella vesiculosa TaxID=518738 RepID=A0ABV0FLS1_9GAMM
MFGLLKKYDVHMCSEVKGQVLLNGKPVVGAKVIRELSYIHQVENNDETLTDESGCFFMPKVSISSKKPGDMFVNDTVIQKISVCNDNSTFLLWHSRLGGITEFEEVKEKLTSLNCDLNNKEVLFTFPNKTNENLEFDGESICRWEKDFDIYELNDEDEDFFNF